MAQVKRIILAFVIAPLAVYPIFFINSLINGVPAISAAFVAAYTIPFAHVAEMLLGLPIWLVFRHYKVDALAAFVVGGALIGVIVGMILSRGDPKLPADLGFLFACAVAGAFSATCFHKISN